MSRVAGRLVTYADLRFAVDNGYFRQKWSFSENHGIAANKAAILSRLYVREDTIPNDRMPTWDDLVNPPYVSCSSSTVTLAYEGTVETTPGVVRYVYEAVFNLGTTSGEVYMSLGSSGPVFSVEIIYAGNVIATTYVDTNGRQFAFDWYYNGYSSDIIIRYTT